MAETSTAAPCWVSREATQPMRSMFVSRSSLENPSPFERRVRTTSPSRYSTVLPDSSRRPPTISAIVDFPAPESPVNHSVNPFVMPSFRLPGGCRTQVSAGGTPWFPHEPPPSGARRLSTLVLQMNPTLKFVGIRPPTGPFLLVGPRRARAGDAADRAIARVVQRVVRDVVRLDVAPDLLLAPVRERLDLPDAVPIGALDLPRVSTRRRLVPADTGDPGVVGLERLDERLDLADVAAAVGVPFPEVRALLFVLLGDGDDLGPDQLEPVALDDPFPCLVGLLEEEVRVELDDVHLEAELHDHVDQHGRLLLPGAGQAEAVAELVVGPAKDFLQGVGAEPEAKRFERDDLVGRDVAEVDLGTEAADEPALGGLRRGLEDDVAEVDPVDDLVDEAGSHLAGRAEDAGRATLPRFGDDLPGAGVELVLHPLDPLVGGVDDVGVLRADLGHDDEVLGQLGDQLELAIVREGDGAVRDLDVRDALLGEPRPVLVELVPADDRLEERSAADDGHVDGAVERDLVLEVARDVRGAPAELDDVDVVAGRPEEALDVDEVEALVDDVCEPLRARLRGTRGQVEEVLGTTVRAVHRDPPVACGPVPERRGRASFRARRSQP